MKLTHVLWSLEYMDPQGTSLFNYEKMHFLQLENLIGQLPFRSPTGFNFFFAGYDLPMSEAGITAASPEPESEEEEEEPEGNSLKASCDGKKQARVQAKSLLDSAESAWSTMRAACKKLASQRQASIYAFGTNAKAE